MSRFRIIGVVVVAAAVFALGGCIDVVQYVSGTSFEVSVFTRLTLQKSVFELGAAFGGEEQDLDEMFRSEFELDEESVTSELPAGIDASFQTVNTPYEYGFELSYTAERSVLADLPEDGAAFVPRVGLRNMSIPLHAGGGSGEEVDATTGAFLGSSKYRLMISKRFLSRITEAYLETSNGDQEVVLSDLPDVWMIEFPVVLWFASETTPVVRISY
jgi:hypothetical protein